MYKGGLIMNFDSRYNYIANIVDENGEIEQWAMVPLRRKQIAGGFFMAIQEGFTWISQLNLKGQEMKVLFYIFGKLDFENYINLSQKDVAEALNIRKEHVSRAFKTLEEYGIIHKGPKVGLSWTYRLDPNFGYKGRAKNIQKLQNAIDKAKEKGLEVIKP